MDQQAKFFTAAEQAQANPPSVKPQPAQPSQQPAPKYVPIPSHLSQVSFGQTIAFLGAFGNPFLTWLLLEGATLPFGVKFAIGISTAIPWALLSIYCRIGVIINHLEELYRERHQPKQD